MVNPNAPLDEDVRPVAPAKSLNKWGGADIGIHLIVCVMVGGGIGYALDSWLGWRPWGMLGGGVLGFAAWFRMLMKL